MTENLILLWSKYSKPCSQLGNYMTARKLRWNALCVDAEDIKEWCCKLNITTVPTLISAENDNVHIFTGYNDCTQFLKEKMPRARNTLPAKSTSPDHSESTSSAHSESTSSAHSESTRGQRETVLPSKSPPRTRTKHEMLDQSEKSTVLSPSESPLKVTDSKPILEHAGKTPDQINRERLEHQESSHTTDGGFKKRVDAELMQQQHTAGLVQKKAKERTGSGDIVSRALHMQKQRESSMSK